MPKNQTHTIEAAQDGKTIAAFLRAIHPDFSWTQVRKLIESRHINIGTEVCLDPARRVKLGDSINILGSPPPLAMADRSVRIRFLDEHLVVVEKPAGLNSVRHPSERQWKASRKSLSPTLEDIVPVLISQTMKGSGKNRLRVVQRLDKETSGLLVFARTVAAERGLGIQFASHTVTRQYLALVPGAVKPQRIDSRLVRDRGDGRRGSTPLKGVGKPAITHIDIAEKFPGFTLLSCRLETGRTHQIRIHLAELGHPICGEKVYRIKKNGEVIADPSGFTRLALHAFELGFTHPISGAHLHWTMELPLDFSSLVENLKGKKG